MTTFIFYAFVIGVCLSPLIPRRRRSKPSPLSVPVPESSPRWTRRITMVVETADEENAQEFADALEEAFAKVDERVAKEYGISPARVREHGLYRRISIEEIDHA